MTSFASTPECPWFKRTVSASMVHFGVIALIVSCASDVLTYLGNSPAAHEINPVLVTLGHNSAGSIAYLVSVKLVIIALGAFLLADSCRERRNALLVLGSIAPMVLLHFASAASNIAWGWY